MKRFSGSSRRVRFAAVSLIAAIGGLAVPAVSSAAARPSVSVVAVDAVGAASASVSVNRAVKQIASCTYVVDSTPTVPLSSCGTGLSTGSKATSYALVLPGAVGSHSVAVTVRLTDGGITTRSASYQVLAPPVPLAPKVSLSPNPLDFGTVRRDDTATSLITLTNTGTASLTVSSATMATNPHFQRTTSAANTCGSTLAVGASCIYEIAFVPSTLGDKTSTFSLTSNAATSPDVVTVTGVRGPTLPGAPQNLQLASNTRFAWEAPVDDGGSAILDYEVTFGSSVSSTSGTDYVELCFPDTLMKVRARNSVGYGPYVEATFSATCEG